MSSPVITPLRLRPTAQAWDYLALPDDELEQADLVAMNIAVAKGINALKDLQVQHFVEVVDKWTTEFARRLPAAEEYFWQKGPQHWKNDIRFYRMGMLQSFLTGTIGLSYIPEQFGLLAFRYTNPSDLFLNGLIDTRQGTCASLPLLHVAMARRLGWPVSLALARNHQFSRFDDGEVVYNIESTHPDDAGAFASESDDTIIKRVKLHKLDIEQGGDMRKLTAREMISVFIANRARHYQDTRLADLCDVDCCLSRALFPHRRPTYVMAMMPYVDRGKVLFESNETGHPVSLYETLAARYAGFDMPQSAPSAPPASARTSEARPSSVVAISRVGITDCKGDLR